MAFYFFDNIWQEDKELCDERSFLFRVYKRLVLGKMKEDKVLKVALASQLLLGLY